MAALLDLGLWETVRHRVLRAEQVRQVLLYVARGEADAGIVYLTDAETEPGVSVLEILDEGLHPPIIYSGGLIRDALRQEEARDFLAFLGGPEARSIWRRHGFTSLDTALHQQGLPGD